MGTYKHCQSVIAFSLPVILMLSFINCGKGFQINQKGLEQNTQLPSTGAASEQPASPPIDPVTGDAVDPAVTQKLSANVPTADGVIARISNGLEKKVNPASGNFANALAIMKTNLPKTSNPLQASGFDQAQLVIYAACSDLTTGTTPVMQSMYNVTTAGTIANNRAALVAAGVRMLDQHIAGLASTGPMATQVNQIFLDLVNKSSATAGNTSKIAFMTVCIAANAAGILMLGN